MQLLEMVRLSFGHSLNKMDNQTNKLQMLVTKQTRYVNNTVDNHFCFSVILATEDYNIKSSFKKWLIIMHIL